MNNGNPVDGVKPDDGLGLSPASLRAGVCLPEMKKGTTVRFWDGRCYHHFEVKRRLPGPIYYVGPVNYRSNTTPWLLHAKNFGGVVLDAE